MMSRHRIGALVVTTHRGGGDGEEGRIVGMFTERDVLTPRCRRGACPQFDLGRRSHVGRRGVLPPRTRRSDDVAAMMRERRIRHLPVCDDRGALKGLISIGDLNAWRADGQAIEIHYLNEYIYGRV